MEGVADSLRANPGRCSVEAAGVAGADQDILPACSGAGIGSRLLQLSTSDLPSVIL